MTSRLITPLVVVLVLVISGLEAKSQSISSSGDYNPSYNGTDDPWVLSQRLEFGINGIANLDVSGGASIDTSSSGFMESLVRVSPVDEESHEISSFGCLVCNRGSLARPQSFTLLTSAFTATAPSRLLPTLKLRYGSLECLSRANETSFLF